jgi:glutamine amidotransferase
VPGVGHFASTSAIDAGWLAAIRAAVADGTPLLGICLGLQWLFEGSDEAADVPGLGALDGRCFRLPPPLKVPHVGWNSLDDLRPSQLLDGVPQGTQVYFTHSYAAPVTSDTVASTTHGATFAAAVQRASVCGVQFHPEKSGAAGLRILENFVSMTRHAVQAHHRVS